MDANTIVSALDVALVAARYLVLGVGVLTGLACAGDWLVRTRRLNPFSPPARFFRTMVDPAIAPVERAVVRAGGLPSSAPWWALVAVVVGGIVLLSVLDALRGLIIGLFSAVAGGPRSTVALFVGWMFELLQVALIVRVASSWIRISPYSKWVRWSFVLTEWLIKPLRRVVPTVGMFDITPIVAYFLLSFLQWAFLHEIM